MWICTATSPAVSRPKSGAGNRIVWRNGGFENATSLGAKVHRGRLPSLRNRIPVKHNGGGLEDAQQLHSRSRSQQECNSEAVF
ncbi:unnamed protein product [Zymoseptoria tritici ST99CH_3D7]|uniref:Uncharacterized protein n=1 Tax=Zymoseptoria tritici (strain ST99CH_3D7) TaxID=1276538 RepID=A0A1X7S4D5_ZYMT9|nr:unnamed protein product [Zymoseptoria tritici ST99CH_3D7]